MLGQVERSRLHNQMSLTQKIYLQNSTNQTFITPDEILRKVGGHFTPMNLKTANDKM